MIIEWLKVNVPPDIREKYIQKDQEIWTAFLSTCPGFLGKEVWIHPQKLTEVVLVIRWATREDWISIPKERLKRINQQFAQQVGGTYPIVEISEYQVRKFPQV